MPAFQMLGDPEILIPAASTANPEHDFIQQVPQAPQRTKTIRRTHHLKGNARTPVPATTSGRLNDPNPTEQGWFRSY